MNSITSITTDELEQLHQQLAFYQKNHAQLTQKNAQLQAKIDCFEEQYHLAKHQRFGKSREQHGGQTD